MGKSEDSSCKRRYPSQCVRVRVCVRVCVCPLVHRVGRTGVLGVHGAEGGVDGGQR